MRSDPDLIGAFLKQCEHADPELVLLVWIGQPGGEFEELVRIVEEINECSVVIQQYTPRTQPASRGLHRVNGGTDDAA